MTTLIFTFSFRSTACSQVLFSFSLVCRLTREDLARAAGDGDQILQQVLTVGGLAAAGLSQQHDGLVLAGGEQVTVRRLGHGVDVRSRVLAPTTFEHVHHLREEETDQELEV